MLGELREAWPQTRGRGTEKLGHHLRVGEDRHKIRISVPPRNDVQVNVIRDTGSRHGALIDSEVEPCGVHNVGQNAHGKLAEPEESATRFRLQRVPFTRVLVGNDHEMAGVIGIKVEHDKALRRPVDDVILVVVLI